MRTWEWFVLLVVLFLLCGCSSTNLNSVRTVWTGGWVKASPMDVNTPGKIELGMGYGSLTITPLARGQGAKYTAVTYELLSGNPLYAEEITVFPMGQDAILKISREPESWLKIPFLLDLKYGQPDTNVEVVPVE